MLLLERGGSHVPLGISFDVSLPEICICLLCLLLRAALRRTGKEDHVLTFGLRARFHVPIRAGLIGGEQEREETCPSLSFSPIRSFESIADSLLAHQIGHTDYCFLETNAKLQFLRQVICDKFGRNRSSDRESLSRPSKLTPPLVL